MAAAFLQAAVAHPAVHPFRTVRSRLRWPPVPRADLIRAASVAELSALASARPLEGFNGQVIRLKFLVHLADLMQCTSFVETGTFLGWTATAAVHFLRLPVFTVEIGSVQVHARLRARMLGVGGIEFHRGDSRAILGSWLADPRVGPRPLVYLDAHWSPEHPLRDELRIVIARGRCVVVIDDCRVPHDPGFGFDVHDGRPIELAAIDDLLAPERITVLLPAHPSEQETGARRGTMILLVDLRYPEEALRPFVASLFAPVAGWGRPPTVPPQR